MFALIIGALLLVLGFVVGLRVAACPLLRSLVISANSWAENAHRRKEAA